MAAIGRSRNAIMMISEKLQAVIMIVIWLGKYWTNDAKVKNLFGILNEAYL